MSLSAITATSRQSV